MKKNKIYDFLVDCGYKEEHLQEITEMQAMEMWLQEHGIVGYSYDIADMVTELFGVKLDPVPENETDRICPLVPGEKVYWNVPDNGLTSGYYVVDEIPEDWNEDTPIWIVDDHSAAEVLISELLVQRWVKP